MELPLLNGVNHFIAKYKVAHIALRHQHTLLAIQADFFTNPKVAFNFFIQPTDRQHFTVLI